MVDTPSPSDSGIAPEVTPQPFRWVVLGAVWLPNFCYGMTIVSLAPLIGPITHDLGLSRSQMGTVLGAWQIVYIAAALPCGILLDRIGPRRALLLAFLVIATSIALRAVAGGYATLFLGVAVFGLGGPLVSVGAPKLISLWFTGAERGFAMGAYGTGPILGSVAILSLTNGVLMPLFSGNWRAAILVYVGVVLVCALAWLTVTGHPTYRAVEERLAIEPRESQMRVFTELISIPTVRIFLVMSVGIFFFNHGINNWLPEILRTGGMDASTAGYWASIPALVSIVAALTIPRLATPSRRLRILGILFLSAAGATLLLHFGEGAVLAFGLVMQGIARGGLVTVALLTLIEAPAVESRRAGLAGGLFFSAGEVGGVLGPVSIGMLADFGNGFDDALIVLTVVCLGLIGLTGWLRRHLH